MLIPKTNSIYVINLDEHESIITHRRAEYIPKENEKLFITNIITNIYETQAYNSIMCE